MNYLLVGILSAVSAIYLWHHFVVKTHEETNAILRLRGDILLDSLIKEQDITHEYRVKVRELEGQLKTMESDKDFSDHLLDLSLQDLCKKQRELAKLRQQNEALQKELLEQVDNQTEESDGKA